MPFSASLHSPFRWRDWAATPPDDESDPTGWKRRELTVGGVNRFKQWVNDVLIPNLKGLKDRIAATPRQKVISEILSGVERVRIDTDSTRSHCRTWCSTASTCRGSGTATP